MKRLLISAGLLTLAAGVWFGVNAGAAASFTASEGHTMVKPDQVIDGAWYGAGQKITIDGVVNGDVFCAAEKVEITGAIKGDVLCAAQEIKFTDQATVGGSARLAGQYIVFDDSSLVAGGVSFLAQDVRLMPEVQIGRDLNGAAQNIDIKGTVERDLAVAVELLRVDGQVGRDVDANFESAQFGSQAEVFGDFNYTSSQESSAPKGFVDGKISWTKSDQAAKQEIVDPQTMLYAALTTALFVLVTALILPRFLSNVSQVAAGKFGLVLGVGALTALGMIAVPIVGVILLLLPLTTYIGLTILVIWGLWMLALAPVFSYYLGRIIPHGGNGSVLMNALVGAAVLAIALQIPYVGGSVATVTYIIGSGLLALWLAKNYQKPNYQTAAPVGKLAIKPKRVAKPEE